MTLATLLAHFLDWRVRERGRAYFQSGTVDTAVCGPERVEGRVFGSEEYAVWLARNGKALLASCSCPFFAGGLLCKHIWAVVLEADQRKGLRGPGGDLPIRLTSYTAVQERVRPELPPPTWRDTLHQLAASGVSTATPTLTLNGKEILYLLDVPATLKSQQLTVRAMTGRREEDWQAVTPLSLSRNAVPYLAEPDRTILVLLRLAASESYGTRSYSIYSSQAVAVSQVPPEAAGILFPLIGSTGRFWTRLEKDFKSGSPILWGGGPPWELGLEVREEADGGCRLVGSLRRGEESMAGRSAAG